MTSWEPPPGLSVRGLVVVLAFMAVCLGTALFLLLGGAS